MVSIHFSFPDPLQEGERVRIEDPRSARYGEVGTLEPHPDTGNLWVRHEDGALIFHPFGLSRVRQEA